MVTPNPRSRLTLGPKTSRVPSGYHLPLVQALRVPRVGKLARALRAAGRAGEARATALTVQRRAAAAASAAAAGLPRVGGGGGGSGAAAAAGVELALDEGQRLGTVLVAILLMRVGVGARAAVRVGRVAVRLNDGRLGRRALEALGAGGELFIASSVRVRLWSR